MSDITALQNGQLTLQQFITKVAGEFTSSPLMKLLAPLLLSMLQVELATVLKSPTAAQLIVQDVQTVIEGGTPAIATQAETGAIALISGLTSGETLPEAEGSALTAAAA